MLLEPMSSGGSSMGTTTTDKDVFTKRGIKPEVWQYEYRGRPRYRRWTPDDLDPVRDAYGSLGEQPLDFALSIAKQSAGYLINRFTVDDLYLEGLVPETIYPEFRPDTPVRTRGPRAHWHGDGPPPKGLSIKRPPKNKWWRRTWLVDRDGNYVCPVLTGKARRNHLRRAKDLSKDPAKYLGGGADRDIFVGYSKPLRPIVEQVTWREGKPHVEREVLLDAPRQSYEFVEGGALQKVLTRHGIYYDHNGRNTKQVHQHWPTAKYVFPTAGRTDADTDGNPHWPASPWPNNPKRPERSRHARKQAPDAQDAALKPAAGRPRTTRRGLQGGPRIGSPWAENKHPESQIGTKSKTSTDRKRGSLLPFRSSLAKVHRVATAHVSLRRTPGGGSTFMSEMSS